MLNPGRASTRTSRSSLSASTSSGATPFGSRLCQNLAPVDSAAVVRHPQRDRITLAGGREQYAALSWFPRGNALLRRLNAVVSGVADQVQQGITDLVQDRTVELDLLPLHVEPDLLLQVPREIAHQPGKPLEHFADRRHPGRDHLTLHDGDQPSDALTHLGEHRIGRLDARIARRFFATTSSPTCFISASSRGRSIRIWRTCRPRSAADLLQSYRLDITNRGEGGRDLGIRRPGLQPEGKPAVELVFFQLSQRRTHPADLTEFLGPLRIRAARAPRMTAPGRITT